MTPLATAELLYCLVIQTVAVGSVACWLVGVEYTRATEPAYILFGGDINKYMVP